MRNKRTAAIGIGVALVVLITTVTTVVMANPPQPEDDRNGVQEGAWYDGRGMGGYGEMMGGYGDTMDGYGGMMGGFGGMMGGYDGTMDGYDGTMGGFGGMMGGDDETMDGYDGTMGGYGGMMGGNGGTMGGYGGMMGGNGGTMGGYGGMMGGNGGMMSGYGSYSLTEPLTTEQAQSAVESYLASLENDDLELAEIMVFDNHAYAQVIESSTGIGAFEVLVDNATLTVSPEMGPNLMWNLKYGHMSSFGDTRFGSCLGTDSWMMDGLTEPQNLSAEMSVTPEQAIQAAQSYLNAFIPGTQADEHADAFYGYYTIHTSQDDETTGMLSVNGYSGQVFYHSWHGDLVDMTE